jgi:hypothetical protein
MDKTTQFRQLIVCPDLVASLAEINGLMGLEPFARWRRVS